MSHTIYTIDGVSVTRQQAVRMIMWGTRPIMDISIAAHQLDTFGSVCVGGVDEKGRPIGEVIRSYDVTDREDRKEGRKEKYGTT